MSPRPRLMIPLIFFLLISPIVFAGTQIAGVPDLSLSTIETRTAQDVSLLICPACDGRGVNMAQQFGGVAMDATIEVYLRDGMGIPIANYPFEDIWLESPDLCFCPGGSCADADTDMNGYTQFAHPLCGGGCSENPTLSGMVNGTSIGVSPIPHIKVNSPDMNCDLVVNLSDVALFAGAYWTGYTYCADFFWDGSLDLRDVTILAQHISHSCP